ncbi:TAXI family TRAP transporter solute-binding subunit [Ostreibacterium oceani]|uniref:TAXI family TRAP transporter solute-binding subunit n=1 Tax=Ostreibacterium oceani TaxID=2654998 RepID=A0A6N7ESG2_9GAMM|nr:TAXI family TRAP transporter solute-binding subunit [Ostreibacterium oceani]MPV85481.1 TAXI family TRAP transporter solute-binding subunit [Ostreibacterium oceani]
MKLKTLLIASVSSLMSSLVLSTGAIAQENKNYLLATASTGGTYYPVGVALSTLTKVKLEPKHKLGMSAISSAGSGENIKLLRDNQVQFAILQGLYGYYAATGTGPLESAGKQENLRAVSMLWQNVEHFAVSKADAQTGTVEDFVALKGKKMGMGSQNSGTFGSNKTLLAGLGIDIDNDYDLFYGGYGPTAEALQNGQIAGLGIPAGAPAGAITQLMASASDKVAILDVTDEQIEKMDGGKQLWTRYTIAEGTYPNQEKPIQTIAQPNILAVNADIPEEDVYLITKAMYENLAFLNSIHPATKAMNIESALAGLPLPLHPGAVKYYQEVGVSIPAHLMP